MSKSKVPDSLTREPNAGMRAVCILFAVVGWFFIGFGVICAVVFIKQLASGNYTSEDISGGTVASLFFLIAGAALIIPFSIQTRRRAKFRNYVGLILHQQLTELDKIALLMRKKYKTVIKDVQIMIDNQYFEGAYIDLQNRILKFPHIVPQMVAEKPAETVRVCKCCGAPNTLFIGQVKECEYCSAPLEA